MFIFCVYLQLYTPSREVKMLDDLVRFAPSFTLRVLLYLRASFWFFSQILLSTSVCKPQTKTTKNIIIISYKQFCVVGVGLGTFWHRVMWQNDRNHPTIAYIPWATLFQSDSLFCWSHQSTKKNSSWFFLNDSKLFFMYLTFLHSLYTFLHFLHNDVE